MKKIILSSVVSGIVLGICFSSYGVTFLASLFTLVGFVIYGIILSKNASKSFPAIVSLSIAFEFVCVIIYTLYSQSQMDPSRPSMPFIGAYLFLLLPISLIIHIIIAAIIAWVRNRRSKNNEQ